MNNAGIFPIADVLVTTPNDYFSAWTTGLDGARAITAQIRLVSAGGPGISIVAWLQTSLDGTATAVDIACVSFAGSTESVVFNVSGLTPSAAITAGDAELDPGTVIDGILGPAWRLRLRTLGTFNVGTVVSGRLSAR